MFSFRPVFRLKQATNKQKKLYGFNYPSWLVGSVYFIHFEIPRAPSSTMLVGDLLLLSLETLQMRNQDT